MESRGIPLSVEKAVVVSSDMVTPYGWGTDACWNNILSGKTGISRVNRFSTKSYQSDYAATIDGLTYHQNNSLVMQMIQSLFDKASVSIPQDTRFFLATTKGEIDLMEKSLLAGNGDVSACNFHYFLQKVCSHIGIKDTGMIISAACASSTTAVARAAALIRSGNADCVLVIACDSVTEFVFSGFSSLMALDKFAARPFDKNRNGLSLGEAAAFALIMSESRARREKREITGEIGGWGLSDDANHMTGPSRNSDGLILSINKALKSACIGAKDICFIAAHGTGTLYNDAMEMKAFHCIFRERTPVYSIKGGTGHTMGATGLIEIIIALRSLREKTVPPTINLQDADADAHGWVSHQHRTIKTSKRALITNAGFGGINAAVVVA
jgi:3-oxoacyl-[acyl-carrier-protein] synthase II